MNYFKIILVAVITGIFVYIVLTKLHKYVNNKSKKEIKIPNPLLTKENILKTAYPLEGDADNIYIEVNNENDTVSAIHVLTDGVTVFLVSIEDGKLKRNIMQDFMFETNTFAEFLEGWKQCGGTYILPSLFSFLNRKFYRTHYNLT